MMAARMLAMLEKKLYPGNIRVIAGQTPFLCAGCGTHAKTATGYGKSFPANDTLKLFFMMEILHGSITHPSLL